jgi:hypothetical protein
MLPVIRLLATSVLSSTLILGAAPQEETSKRHSVDPEALVREEQEVVIHGIKEVWRLEWKSAPKPVCEPSDVSLTCPCRGFAYGEGGDLDLVRLRDQAELELLPIGPLFGEGSPGGANTAVLKHWNPDYEKDAAAAERDDFAETVTKRPSVKVMHFVDFDHDGEAREFLPPDRVSAVRQERRRGDWRLENKHTTPRLRDCNSPMAATLHEGAGVERTGNRVRPGRSG